MHPMKKNNITQEQQQSLLDVLKKRFEQHMQRHPQLKWEDVQQRLEKISINYGRSTRWRRPVESPM